ncbi:MAG TPA: LysM peptidoglycan-binding domain-containing M23 family metallopeptidase [Anaerolineales bacterium]|nr:LysM peptidoglycan-binding domain-containing M23 family metallopeptidase [Anaerolineales bacterium]
MRKPFVPFLLLLAILACNFPTTTMGGATAAPVFASPESTPLGAAAPAPTLPPTRDPNLPVVSPTPDSAHSLPTLRGDYIEYRVQPYDFLSSIAVQFGVTLEELIAANDLPDPNQLEVGQVLLIPPQSPADSGPDFKIVPDSEMVNGPYALFFDVAAFVDAQPGYLKQHREEVDQRSLSGAQIVQRVASEYSVNPKLLLAVLEYQSGWLSDPNPRTSTLEFAMGVTDSWRTGLYRQLSWAADNLNKGYYDWKSGATSGWKLTDASFVPAAATINPGTAGVQYLFSLLYPENEWRHTVSENGVFETYNRLFGYPFDVALDPLVPADLAQPTMQLPFESGVPWVYSGGPHGGWGNGSAWAALDFAPRGDMLGCNQSVDWVVAAADGLIARADNGAVVQDLDADGYEQTGWTILYMHVGAEGRVQAGQTVQAGERIGHPSCEGGLASATHLHLARRYNGEWIPASGVLAFVLDGWVSTSDGVLYDGALQREGISVEACECRDPANMLQR